VRKDSGRTIAYWRERKGKEIERRKERKERKRRG
jgi:hypothetical protein